MSFDIGKVLIFFGCCGLKGGVKVVLSGRFVEGLWYLVWIVFIFNVFVLVLIGVKVDIDFVELILVEKDVFFLVLFLFLIECVREVFDVLFNLYGCCFMLFLFVIDIFELRLF